MILNNFNFFTHIDGCLLLANLIFDSIFNFNFAKNKYKCLIVILLTLNKLPILLTLNMPVTDAKMLPVILMTLNKLKKC